VSSDFLLVTDGPSAYCSVMSKHIIRTPTGRYEVAVGWDSDRLTFYGAVDEVKDGSRVLYIGSSPMEYRTPRALTARLWQYVDLDKHVLEQLHLDQQADPNAKMLLRLPTALDVAECAKAAGMTMAEVCRKADIIYQTWYYWRDGRTTPWLKNVAKMFAAIGVQPADVDLLLPEPDDVYRLAALGKISVADACRRAKICPEAIVKWKAGRTSSTIRTVQMLLLVLYDAFEESVLSGSGE
jgi:hypothetical protein